MATETRHTDEHSAESMIPDLRGTTLRQLAMQAAVGEKDVTDVVKRIRVSLENPSRVPAMMFHSAI